MIATQPSAHLEVDGLEFKPTDITFEKDRYDKAGLLEVDGLWEHEGTPPENSTVELFINDQLSFTGKIETVSTNGDGSHSLTAFDAVKKLKRTKISRTYEGASVKQIVEDVAKEAGVELNEVIAVARTFMRERMSGSDGGDARIIVNTQYNKTPATEVLNDARRMLDCIWQVNEANVLYVGPLFYDSSVGNIRVHKRHELSANELKPMTNPSENPPPYKRVVVVGESPRSDSETETSLGGDDTSHIIRRYNIRAVAGSGEPTYTHKSDSITTVEQAKAAANAILREFQKQRASGKVVTVGRGEDIRPNDTIEMPTEYDNKEYLVSGIKVRMNRDDGYISDLECGGMIDG